MRSPDSPQSQRGTQVHNFCNKFYDHLRFHNKHFEVDKTFFDEFSGSSLVETISYLYNFIEFEQKRWEICRNLMPQDPKKLFMPLLRESKFFGDTLEQVTIVDRLDLRVDGNYTLIEYKSEKFKDQPWRKTEFRREMMFEKTTLEDSTDFKKKFPKDIVEFVIYFPHSNDVMIEKFNWRSFQALQKSTEKMRSSVKVKSFPCNVDYHCRFCFFNLICPMELQ
jgi:hypothetical protein